MKIKDGPNFLAAVIGLAPAFGATVILRSIQPTPGNALSGLAYVLYSGIWILFSCLFWKPAVFWRKIEITGEGITEESFFLFWRVRIQKLGFADRHFVELEDFRRTGLCSGNFTSCFFAGHKCRISFEVQREKAEEIREIIKSDNHKSNGASKSSM